MNLLKKVSLLFILFTPLLLLGETRNFPLELDVKFSPCPCGDRVYLFSKDGRNQTLNIKEDAPNCNLMPIYPIFEPLCLNGYSYLVDKDGILFSLSEKGLSEIKRFNQKVVGIYKVQNKIYIILKSKIVDLETFEQDLPFEAKESFQDSDNIFISSDNQIAIFKDEKIKVLAKFNEPFSEPFCCTTLGNGYLLFKNKYLLFLNSKGKIKRKFQIKSECVSLTSKGDLVLVASKDHFLRLFDKKGNVKWQYRLDGIPTKVLQTQRGFLFGVLNGKKIILLDEKKGIELFSFMLNGGEIVSNLSYDGLGVWFYSLSDDLEPYLNFVSINE